MIYKTIPITLEIRAVPANPDFFPAVDPAFMAVLKGAVATYTLTFTDVAGYANPIKLALLGLPDGAAATFGVNPALVTDVVALAITTANAAIGNYPMLIEMIEVVPNPEPPPGPPSLPHVFRGQWLEAKSGILSVEGLGVRKNVRGNPVPLNDDGSFGTGGAFDQTMLIVQGDVAAGALLNFYVDGAPQLIQLIANGSWLESVPFESGGITEVVLAPM